jgi:hypothetical protein
MPVERLGLLLASMAAILPLGFAQTPEDFLLDETAVPVISLEMDPGDWVPLQRNVLENTVSWLERDVMEGITQGKNITLLAKRLAAIPEYRTAYLRALVKATTLLGGTDGWADREITREFAVLHEAAADDPNKWCFDHACGTAQFESDVRWLHGFLSERSRNVLAGVAKAGYAADQAP